MSAEKADWTPTAEAALNTLLNGSFYEDHDDAAAMLRSLREAVADRERYKAALEAVSTKGHPEWCQFSCFGGIEDRTCDCWVVVVRRALNGREP